MIKFNVNGSANGIYNKNDVKHQNQGQGQNQNNSQNQDRKSKGNEQRPGVSINGNGGIKLIGLDQSNVVKMSDREHALARPDLYISSTAQEEREARVFDLQKKLMKNIKTRIPAALEQLALEAITNATDNAARSRKESVDPKSIIVTMNRTTLSVKNFGLPVPIELHKQTNMPVPEAVFSEFRTGSNLTGARSEAGMNAIGIKAVNVFSNYFDISLFDALRGKSYHQTWYNTMLSKTQGVTQDFKGETSTEVTFSPVFERFGYPQQRFPDEFYELIAAICADASYNSKIPVYFIYDLEAIGPIFNKEDVVGKRESIVLKASQELRFECWSPFTYGAYYFPDYMNKKNTLIYYEWPDNTKISIYRDGYQESEKRMVLPKTELVIVDTPNRATTVAFTNSLYNRDGGVHVTEAYKAVTTSLLNEINEGGAKAKTTSKNTATGKRGKAKQEKKKEKPVEEKVKKVKLTQADVKNHLTIILCVRVVDPRFNSQTKAKLLGPHVTYKIDEEFIEEMHDWKLPLLLRAALNAKNVRSILKTERDIRNNFDIENGFAALNVRIPSLRHKCTLFIVEGRSAMGYARNLVTHLGGRRFWGAIPMKGKVLNIMDATPQEIERNKELCALRESLGLSPLCDYSLEADRAKLKYGSVIILSDADDDGQHIRGLLLTFFTMYPGLIEAGYIKYLRTPHARAVKGATEHVFFTKTDYTLWSKAMGELDGWKVKYYKGLATSGAKDVKEDSKNPWVIDLTVDNFAHANIKLAFHPDFADKRKDWVTNYVEYPEEKGKIQSISDFINTQVIQYSVTNVERSIPDFLCGLKPSQIKLVWSAFKKWHIHTGVKYPEVKLTTFTSFASNETNYHHDPSILNKTVITMAQSYVGANNMPYFSDADGQFGTREDRGRDAGAPRYLSTSPSWWLKYIFREEDMCLLEQSRRIIEGDKCEPLRLFPILPIHVINGMKGVATGFSTKLPAHDPLDVIRWIRAYINDRTPRRLMPWYRGFTGHISKIRRTKESRKINGLTLTINGEPPREDPFESKEMLQRVEEKKRPEKSVAAELVESKDGGFAFSIKQVKNGIGNMAGNILEKGAGKERDTSSTMRIVGRYERDLKDRNKLYVKELPIGKSMLEYSAFLKSLKAEGVITDFEADTHGDKPNFTVYGMKEPSNRALQLVSVISYSNIYCLDMDRKARHFQSLGDLMKYYCEERLKIYKQRKEYILNQIGEKIAAKSMRMKYISLVAIERKVEIRERKKAELTEELGKYDLPYAIVNKVKTGELTLEEINKLKGEIQQLENERKTLGETDVKKIWLSEIAEFQNEYCKRTGENYYEEPVNVIEPSNVDGIKLVVG